MQFIYLIEYNKRNKVKTQFWAVVKIFLSTLISQLVWAEPLMARESQLLLSFWLSDRTFWAFFVPFFFLQFCRIILFV